MFAQRLKSTSNGIYTHAYGWFIVDGQIPVAGTVHKVRDGKSIAFVGGHLVAGGSQYGVCAPTNTVSYGGKCVATGLRVSFDLDGVGMHRANRHQRRRFAQAGRDVMFGLVAL